MFTFPILGITHLFCEEEADTLEHLAGVESCDCQVEEDTVEHCPGDFLERVGQQHEGEPDEDVREDGGNSSLARSHNTATHNNATSMLANKYV